MKQKVTLARCIFSHRFTTHASTLLILVVLSITLLTSTLVSAADSDLDLTFDGDGIVTTDHSEFEEINDILIQPDGKIVVAGHTGISHAFTAEPLSMMVARYNMDGSLDATFGNGGIVTTSIGTYAKAWGVALQPDGKILIAGRSGTFLHSSSTVVRYNPDGTLDTTFGGSGIVTTLIGSFSQITDVAIQPDGKIVTSGEATLPGTTVVTFVSTLVRYNTDGSLDWTFDSDGVSQAIPSALAAPLPVSPFGIALQMDQKIVVAEVCVLGSTIKFCVSRYNSDGSLDNTFDGDGLAVTDFDSSFGSIANAISIQADGKIIAAGQSFTSNGIVPALARYNIDGSLDNSFDGDGRVTTANSLQFEAKALALQPNGKMVIVGRGFVSDPFFHSVMTVARYDADGSLDETFGSGGIATTSVGTVNSGATAVAVHADGRIVAGGVGNLTHREEVTLSDFALVRYGTAINDSNGGWANGGGWIDSPPGAFGQMPGLTGKANFGFVLRHRNGTSVPTGNVQFHFDSLRFQSTTSDWLVLSGVKAQCQGVGTINGSGSYRFMLTVIDGDQPGGDGQDNFRIRIWNESDGVIYDNQLNGQNDSSTVLSGGSIEIHR